MWRKKSPGRKQVCDDAMIYEIKSYHDHTLKGFLALLAEETRSLL